VALTSVFNTAAPLHYHQYVSDRKYGDTVV
jgi:hypothetical protein